MLNYFTESTGLVKCVLIPQTFIQAQALGKKPSGTSFPLRSMKHLPVGVSQRVCLAKRNRQ